MIGSHIDYDIAPRELELEFETSIELKKWRMQSMLRLYQIKSIGCRRHNE
jgi:hypothetical protein